MQRFTVCEHGSLRSYMRLIFNSKSLELASAELVDAVEVGIDFFVQGTNRSEFATSEATTWR